MSRIERFLLAVLVAAVPMTCGSCAAVAWLTATFAPAPKVKAIFELPKDKKVLVFVDDIRHPVTYEPVKADLTEQLNKELMDHKLAASVVPYEKLLDLIAASPDFNQWHVPTIGQKLGADLIIYVEIDRFMLKEDEESPLWQGLLETHVKVVDSQAGRLWPDDRPNGHPVDPVDTQAAASSSPLYGAAVAHKLARDMAVKLAQLFYEHEESLRR